MPTAWGRRSPGVGAAAAMECAGDKPDSPQQVSAPAAAHRAPLCVRIGTRAMSSWARVCAHPCVCVCVCVCARVCARARLGRAGREPGRGGGAPPPGGGGASKTKPGRCLPSWAGGNWRAGSQQLPGTGRVHTSLVLSSPPQQVVLGGQESRTSTLLGLPSVVPKL